MYIYIYIYNIYICICVFNSRYVFIYIYEFSILDTVWQYNIHQLKDKVKPVGQAFLQAETNQPRACAVQPP